MPIVKGALRIAVDEWIKSLKINSQIRSGTRDFIEEVEQEGLDLLAQIYSKIGAVSNLPPLVNPAHPDFSIWKKQIGIGAIGGAVGSIGTDILSAPAQPVTRELGYAVNNFAPNLLLPPGSLIETLYRFPQNKNEVYDNLRKQGYDGRTADYLVEINRPLLNDLDIVTLWRRGEIDDTILERMLAAKGYSDISIDSIKILSNILPPVQDLITMAVREAFTPETVEKFEYDSGFPIEILKFTEAQGLSEEWVRRYWWSHWQLPGTQQVFEMFQRLRPGRTNYPVDGDTLDLFLKTADIPTFWRNRLKEIAYQPYTRVDIRRMYELNKITFEEMIEAHRDIGYDENHARKLSEFVVADRAAARIDITKPKILKAYKEGAINKQQAIDLLNSINVDSAGIMFDLGLVDLEVADHINDIKIDLLKVKYVEGLTNDLQANIELNELKLPSTQIELLLLEWRLARLRKVKHPAKAEIEDWYTEGIINDNEYLGLMQALGYRDIDIQRFLRSLKGQIARQATKLLADTLLDAQRKQESNLATAYQRTAVNLDLQIAEHKLAIANIKLAQVDEIEENIILQYDKEILEHQVRIKELERTKAQTRVSTTT